MGRQVYGLFLAYMGSLWCFCASVLREILDRKQNSSSENNDFLRTDTKLSVSKCNCCITDERHISLVLFMKNRGKCMLNADEKRMLHNKG